MKYLILIPDGLADWGIEKLGGKTPLEYAQTENMDFIAKEGICGLAKTIPEGFEPGSDIANLSILGVDPRKYYTGRGPIEALAKGVRGDIIFRCNLVYIENGVMVDYSGNRITDREAKGIIKELNENKPFDFVEFHHGFAFRNLLVVNGIEGNVKTYPPHDIMGERVEKYLPSNGELAEVLRKLIDWSMEFLPNISEKVNAVWPWSGGKLPNMPSFEEMHKLRGCMISEVDLLYGIANALKMDSLRVEGVTAFVDTNYKGLAKATIKALHKYDLVVLHTEGIDEAGHEGDVELKVEAIELYDEKIVGYIIDRIDLEDTRIMLLPDHPTPIKVRTHVAEPVPVAIYCERKDDVKRYSERACRKGKLGFVNATELIKIMKRV